MASLNRHQLRQGALQSLFGLSMNPDAELEVVVAQVMAGDPEIKWEGALPADLIELVTAVLAHQDEIDLLITENLADGWTLDRLNLIDLVLLRLAIYEARYTDTPAKISVNEALNLAKEFSDEKSSKFINGVLGKVLTF